MENRGVLFKKTMSECVLVLGLYCVHVKEVHGFSFEFVSFFGSVVVMNKKGRIINISGFLKNRQ